MGIFLAGFDFDYLVPTDMKEMSLSNLLTGTLKKTLLSRAEDKSDVVEIITAVFNSDYEKSRITKLLITFDKLRPYKSKNYNTVWVNCKICNFEKQNNSFEIKFSLQSNGAPTAKSNWVEMTYTIDNISI